jgi:hypothetical protein
VHGLEKLGRAITMILDAGLAEIQLAVVLGSSARQERRLARIIHPRRKRRTSMKCMRIDLIRGAGLNVDRM